jgi:hypothetical protein
MMLSRGAFAELLCALNIVGLFVDRRPITKRAKEATHGRSSEHAAGVLIFVLIYLLKP